MITLDSLKHKELMSVVFDGVIHYYDTAYHVKGIRFEITPKEAGHNVPHCHAVFQGQNISVSLIDYSVLAGNIPKQKQKFAVKFVEENIDAFKQHWNQYHSIIL